MSRWKKPKPRKSERDRQRGQKFLLPLHDDDLAPWELDDLNDKETARPQSSKSECAFVPSPPPLDEIPF